jgi:uncharacterized spore protein YtfJ
MSERLSTTDFVATGDRNTEEAGVGNGNGSGAAKTVPAQTALFDDKECNNFRSRWDEIQIRFVDDPRKAAEDADALVAETMRRLAEIFSEERKNMESQWSRGENVSTEDLRLALQRYRSFFNRLLVI